MLHFLIIAALLFAVYQLLNPDAQSADNQVIVSSGRVEQLRTRFEQSLQREPQSEELAQLVRNYALNEIYSREARALGLDRDDAVVKQRLRQKMEFMIQDAVPAAPERSVIEDWYLANGDRYRAQARFSFEQVYVAVDREQQVLDSLLEQQQQQIAAGRDPVGDSSLLPAQMQSAPVREVARLFGDDFVAAIDSLPINEWQGPVRSGIGFHFVKLRSREPGVQPPLEDIYDKVLYDWQYEQRAQAKVIFEEALLERYEIIVEGD